MSYVLYAVGLVGMWIFCDGWISLAMYIGRPNQTWLKDHIIRLIRCFAGIFLMIVGGLAF